MLTPVPPPVEVRLERTALSAARVVQAVHHGTRPDVLAALADVPAADRDVLLITLAAMVDPDRDVIELLAWCSGDGTEPPAPVRGFPREHGTPRGYYQHRHLREDACAECRAAHAVEGRPQICRDEFARLRAEGVPVIEAAQRTRLRDVLAAHQERAAASGFRSRTA